MEAQEQIKKNGGKSNNVRHRYLLNRRLRCQCGAPVYSRAQKDRRGKRVKYYHCSDKVLNGKESSCKLPYFACDELDFRIWQWITKLITDPDYLRQLLADSVVKEKFIQADTAAELDGVRARIAEQAVSIERLTRSYVAGVVDEALFNKLKVELDEATAGLAAQEQEILKRLDSGRSRRAQANEIEYIVSEFQKAHQAGVLELAPYEVQAAWVNALDIEIVLEARDGKRYAHIKAVVGEDVIPVEEMTSGQPKLIWCIFYTLELPILSKAEADQKD